MNSQHKQDFRNWVDHRTRLKRIAVIDLETTGRDPYRGTIVEIGIALLDITTGYISELMDTVVKERNFNTLYEAESLEKCWVFENSSLTIEQVENAPTWDEIYPYLQKILAKFPVTSFNVAFDLGFLIHRGLSIPMRVNDPMVAATPLFKKISPNNPLQEYQYPSVQECWNYFFPDETNYNESHRAYDDAVHEAKIMYALSKKIQWPQEITFIPS